MHKKLLILFVIIIFAVGATNVAAQEENAEEEDTLVAGWDSHFNAGNVLLSGGLGLGGFWYGLGLNLYPGVEVIFAQPDIGGVVPLSFGIAARGIFGFYPVPTLYGGFDIGVSALATAHLGLKGLDLNSKFLNSLDFYIGLGVSVFFVRPYSSYFLGYYLGDVVSPVQFASFQGVNYFITNNFAIYLESTYLGLSNYYLTFGVLFKIGK